MPKLKAPAGAANTGKRNKPKLSADHFGLIVSILPSGVVVAVQQDRVSSRAFTGTFAREWKGENQ